MDWKDFFIGLGLLAGSYLYYRLCKWTWPADLTYKYFPQAAKFRDWILIAAGVIVGIVFIIESLPSKI